MLLKRILVLVFILTIFIGCSEKKEKNIQPMKNEVEPIQQVEIVPSISFEEKYKDQNVGVLNDSNVRLREAPNLNCKTIKLLNSDEIVNIISRSYENQEIEQMSAHWYEVTTINDELGWVYGYFLDLYIDDEEISKKSIFLYNDQVTRFVSEHAKSSVERLLNYNIDKINFDLQLTYPKFENEIDEEVYDKIAGIYLYDELLVPSHRTTLSIAELSWGLDYYFGRGTTRIDYSNGIWTRGGDGESIEFDVLAIADNVIKTNISDIILTQNGIIDFYNSKLYRASSPSHYLEYLSRIKEYQLNYISKFNIHTPKECKDVLLNKPFEVYELLKSSSPANLVPYISSEYGLKIEFNPSIKIGFNQIKELSNEYKDAIQTISSDLQNKYASDFNLSMIFFNEYVVNKISDRQHEFPGSITVEMIITPTEYISIVFIEEENEWKIVCIENHTLDFA